MDQTATTPADLLQWHAGLLPDPIDLDTAPFWSAAAELRPPLPEVPMAAVSPKTACASPRVTVLLPSPSL